MQFDRSADGKLTPLPKPSVDTGAGLERMSAVMQGVTNNYDIDLFVDLIHEAARLLGTTDYKNPSLRVIADHIRACSFLIVDGVVPSNEGRGYVLRRIARRAMRHGYKFGTQPGVLPRSRAYAREGDGRGVSGARHEAEVRAARCCARKASSSRARSRPAWRFSTLRSRSSAAPRSSTATPSSSSTTPTAFRPTSRPTSRASAGSAVDMEGYERAMDVQRRQSQAASQFGVDLSAGVKIEGKTDFLGYERS